MYVEPVGYLLELYVIRMLYLILQLQEFILEQDYNRMTAVREYLAHQGRVTGIIFTSDCEWVLSIGRDKLFQLHNSETGQKLGSYQTDAWYTALQYPFTKPYVYISRLTKLNFFFTKISI